MGKNILVVGGGGREHALCWAISQSSTEHHIFCAPGNPGIAQIAECVDIALTDLSGLVTFAEKNKIDFTIIGGETLLALGVVDRFDKNNQKIVGPTLQAARLESSKIFAKEFMMRHNIPTASFRTAASVEQASEILQSGEFGDAQTPVVVKADGLAGGKGVVVANNHLEAIIAVKSLLHANLIDKASLNQIILEQTLTGREVSLLLFADGNDFAVMPPARDYKRIGNNDTGLNTGGMGAITDRNLLTKTEMDVIAATMIQPTLDGAKKEGFPFRGILFLGLMMTANGPKLLEYNVRFGDPEAQAILVRLKSDLIKICESIISGNLKTTNIEFSDESSACVVLAANGYPAKPTVGDVISGLDSEFKDVLVFHAGTQINDKGEILTAGGRVLGITAKDETLNLALAKAYAAIPEIAWNGLQYRQDIGK